MPSKRTLRKSRSRRRHKNLLHGSRVYLSGPMDFVASRADEQKIGWRNRVSEFLKRLGVTVFDPSNPRFEAFMNTDSKAKRAPRGGIVGAMPPERKERKPGLPVREPFGRRFTSICAWWTRATSSSVTVQRTFIVWARRTRSSWLDSSGSLFCS